jgi:hypothetical protein
MSELLWRADVDALLHQHGGGPHLGRIFPLVCHAEAGVQARVLKDVPTHPGQTVLHLVCRQCHRGVVDIAVVEPVTTPRRCRHQGPLDWGAFRGEVMLACRRCDRVHFAATPAAAPSWLRRI